MTATRQKTLYYLVGGLILSVGTPIYLGLTRPGVRFYLLQPVIYAVQAIPYLFAAGLWLPWRSERASQLGQILAAVLLGASLLLYVPMLTGLWSTGGDMVGLAFFLIAIIATGSILFVTLVSFGVLWLRHRDTGL